MSSRSYITHTVSNTAPVAPNLGDEYYNPNTNKLFKALAINGTTVINGEIPVATNPTTFASTVSINGTLLVQGATTLGTSLSVINTTSAVNYVQVTGAIAGNPPVISSQGATTPNLDLTLAPMGAGRINITTSIKPKVNSVATVASPLVWNSTSFDEYAINALANDLTINADLNASPADGQFMIFRIKDNGTARTLTWTQGATNAFRAVGVTLPSPTVPNKLLYVGCIYNADLVTPANSRWDVIAVSQEA
jgi:hypothetical protein